ncbi:MAG: hypothetical protein P8077_08295, partial [Gammaproteobacteria bacterium]
MFVVGAPCKANGSFGEVFIKLDCFLVKKEQIMVQLTILKTHEKNTIHAHEALQELESSSPALSVVLPFHEEDHWLIGPGTPAREAYRMLQLEHALFKVVVREDDTFLGVVDLNQLSEQTLIRRVGAGYSLDELTVSDFMIHRDEMFAIAYEDIQRASIRDLVAVFAKESKRYGIVLRAEDEGFSGIVSADYISRRAHIHIRSADHPVILDAV